VDAPRALFIERSSLAAGHGPTKGRNARRELHTARLAGVDLLLAEGRAMTHDRPLSFRAPLAEYQREAQALFDALATGDRDAQWRFKWMHSRFRGNSVDDVAAAVLELADAREVVARDYGFETWAELAAFAERVTRDGPALRFESVIEAVIAGDVAVLDGVSLEVGEQVQTAAGLERCMAFTGRLCRCGCPRYEHGFGIIARSLGVRHRRNRPTTTWPDGGCSCDAASS
jgi:hypothetical protein